MADRVAAHFAPPFDAKRGAALTATPIGKVARVGLRKVLATEREEWLERLAWDFSEVATLIVEAVTHGVLRGVALLDGREPVGIAVYTVEYRRCLIGEIYVAAPYRSEEAGRALVAGLLRHMPAGHARRRIESQSIVFDTRGVDGAFAEAGFARQVRCYMMADATESHSASALRSSGRISIRSWRDGDYGRVAEIIYLAYKGTPDVVANTGYRTRDGCADLLDALTDSAWCGSFDPALTRVAVDEATGRMCGAAVCSRVSASTAHLGQVSVLPAYQGRGVGRALVEGAVAGAREAGLHRVSLAVTLANERALRLYRSCGFRPALEFPVFFR
jgi:ribosomal protein S18 acetylase RimI-like enzyme